MSFSGPLVVKYQRDFRESRALVLPSAGFLERGGQALSRRVRQEGKDCANQLREQIYSGGDGFVDHVEALSEIIVHTEFLGDWCWNRTLEPPIESSETAARSVPVASP